MVLSGSKKTTYQSSIVNQNQGGGSKKAGFPYQIGRGSYTSIFFQSTDPMSGQCCNLKHVMTNRFTMFPNQNLPIGAHGTIKMH
jgi:hypothetical protein